MMRAGWLPGLLLVPTMVVAQEQTPRSAEASQQAQPNKSADDAQQKIEARINRFAKEVDLTSAQKKELQAQLTKAAPELKKTWQQYTETQHQVIGLEAQLVVALEASLEPAQKQQAQQNREGQAKGLTAAKPTASARDAAGQSQRNPNTGAPAASGNQDESGNRRGIRQINAETERGQTDRQRTERGQTTPGARTGVANRDTATLLQ